MLNKEQIEKYQNEINNLNKVYEKQREKLNNVISVLDTITKEFQSKCSHKNRIDNEYFSTFTCKDCGKVLYF